MLGLGDAVWIALITAMSGVTSSVMLSWLGGRQRAQERQEVFARQDAVAKLLQENTDRVSAEALETHGQLRVIHTLVNSSMTRALQSEYDATRAGLLSLEEIIDLKKRAGHSPSVDALATVESIKVRLAEMAANLADRHKQDVVVNSQSPAVG